MPRQEERAKLGMKPDDSLPAKDKKVCATMKEKNTANVQEGIDNLNKALQLRPDYDDAMAYMNLMYRERADIQCDDPAARAADLKTADEWVDKTMATKKAKAEKQPAAALSWIRTVSVRSCEDGAPPRAHAAPSLRHRSPVTASDLRHALPFQVLSGLA